MAVRWVNGSSGSGVSGATDLNTIPAGVVERVEVLRDGASAIYGSNAIAGVVNVITRRTDGFAASVYGGTHAVGGDTSDIELSLGGERGTASASIHLSHTDQTRVSAADHALTRWRNRAPASPTAALSPPRDASFSTTRIRAGLSIAP